MTGTELLNAALDIIGLRDHDGSLPEDTADLSQRALGLINILLAENAILNARIERSAIEPICIRTLGETIAISPLLSESVLPYGLAMLFMLGEDNTLAKSYESLYTSARISALKAGKSIPHAITEVYK